MRHHNDETSWAQMIKEREELERNVTLLREQLRVADVAYNYWTKRCQELEAANEQANKLIEDEANKRTELQERLDEWKFNEEAWGNSPHHIRAYIQNLRHICGEAAEELLLRNRSENWGRMVNLDLITRLQSAEKGEAL